MARAHFHSPINAENIKSYLLVSLIFLLQLFLPALVAEACASEKYPRGYSVKPLDLSRPLANVDLMVAGQLGGVLNPTHNAADPVVNASFGLAMQAWNRHEYPQALELFRAHLAEYPRSPWAAEALLHLACNCLSNGRYLEAQSAFLEIISANVDNPYPGAQMMVHKARFNLANLRAMQGNFPEAIELLRIIKQSSPDWRNRTYAAQWMQRLSREKARQPAAFNCGTRALAHLLKKAGKERAAAKVLALSATSPRGQSMKELQTIAAAQGYHLNGLKLNVSHLSELPLPAIVQLNGLTQGDLGHYWVLEKSTKDTLNFYDPRSRRRFSQTPAQFAKEWGGHALVLARKQKLPGVILAARKMADIYGGGYCSFPRDESDLGEPECNPGEPDSHNPGESPCGACGSPKWSVNKVSMNFFVKDVPLWHRSPIGPKVEIALSYNSQSAIANYEPFGNKWQFNYGTYPVEDSSGQVTIFMPDGRRDAYTPDGSGGYTSPPGIYNTLVKTGSTHYELWFPEDTVYVYDIPAGTNSLQPFLVQIKDAHGLALTFGYDSNVYLTTITDALGRVTNLAYNAAGHVTSVTDPFGRTAAFQYDGNGNLTKITDMGGYWSILAYDEDIYLTGITNSRGSWSFYTEPADGIMSPDDITLGGNLYPAPGTAMNLNYRITATNPLGFKEEYYYSEVRNNVVNPMGPGWHVNPMDYVEYADLNHSNYYAPKTQYGSSLIGYSGWKGKIGRIIPAMGSRIEYIYDAVGNRTEVRNVQGDWNYVYNARGLITSIRNPYYKWTSLTYASNNVDLISVSNDLINRTLTYNSTHDVTSVTDNLGNLGTTTYAYNSSGQISIITDALGIVNNYIYDEWHRLSAVTRGGQTLHQYTYDALDRIRTHTDPTGLTLTYDYNDLNQVTKITYPDGKSKTYQYSTCCPFIVDSVTERSGQTTFYSYDRANHLTAVTDPAGNVTAFTYDRNGNRATIVDPKGNTTGFNYDSNNRIVKKTYADGTFDSFTYDNHSYWDDLPISRTNANGVTTNYTYTTLRMLYSFADNNSTSYYSYDAYGRRTKAQGSSYFINYAYDANSRLLSVDGPWRDVFWTPYDKITYQYDALNRRTGMTLAHGRSGPYTSVAYTYDSLNRLTEVNVGGQVYSYGYAGASPLVRSLTRPNGSVTTYDYDVLNRLMQMTTRVGEAVVNSYAYTYNGRDLRAGETTVEAAPPAPYAVELVNYEYNNVNALVRMTTPEEKLMTYDAAGNLTRGYTPEGYAFTAVYDGSNRLSSLSYTDGAGVVNQTQFIYIGNALIWKKNYKNGVLSKERRYNYDGNLLVEERDGANNVVTEYTWGLGLPGGIGGLLDLYQGAVHFAYLYDGKGNVTALLDPNANVAATYQYDPFGKPMGPANSLSQPFQFSTKLYDDKTGLSYYGYRFYNPALRRWLTRDPLGELGGVNLFSFVDSVGKPFSGTNLYTFVGNDPINYVDPFGLWQWYGNWGGPNWTGGQVGTWDTIDHSKALPPIDNQDASYMNHDKCYSKCRSICNSKDRADCFRDCDRQLSRDLSNLGDGPSNNWQAKVASWLFSIRNPGPNQ
ncbi:MAG: RHS repeat-associated core domain-containing protein [Desulfuromonadaceae bacterium]